MEKCKMWTVLSKEELPKDRKLIGNQWVFAEKREWGV
jgi:hypothetical protein